MNTRRLLILVVTSVISAAIGTVSLTSPQNPGGKVFAAARVAQSSPVISDEIAQVRAQWVKDLHTKQLDQIASLYTEDAEFLHATGTRVSGRAAIRELCKNIMDTMTSDLTLRTATSERSGSLAYDSGDYSETLTAVSDGKKTQYSGTYVMIFRRQANGTWLIAEQVWTDSSSCAH